MTHLTANLDLLALLVGVALVVIAVAWLAGAPWAVLTAGLALVTAGAVLL